MAVRNAKLLLAIWRKFTIGDLARTQFRNNRERLRKDIVALVAVGLPIE